MKPANVLFDSATRRGEGRRLRDREGTRGHRRPDADVRAHRDGRLPVARAGVRPRRDAGVRPVRRRVPALLLPHRRAAVQRVDAGRDRDEAPATTRCRRCGERRPDVPPDFEAVVMRALEKDPARRFSSRGRDGRRGRRDGPRGASGERPDRRRRRADAPRPSRCAQHPVGRRRSPGPRCSAASGGARSRRAAAATLARRAHGVPRRRGGRRGARPLAAEPGPGHGRGLAAADRRTDAVAPTRAADARRRRPRRPTSPTRPPPTPCAQLPGPQLAVSGDAAADGRRPTIDRAADAVSERVSLGRRPV